MRFKYYFYGTPILIVMLLLWIPVAICFLLSKLEYIVKKYDKLSMYCCDKFNEWYATPFHGSGSGKQ